VTAASPDNPSSAGAAAPRSDLVVVGAGIVGLAHAAEAVRRGLSVTVVERDERAVGASVRNFGHACITAQTGRNLALARAARTRWIEVGRDAGVDVAECGTAVVARSPEELAVLEEFAAARPAEVELLSAAGLRRHVPMIGGSGSGRGGGVVGGAFLPLDLRVDQRRAVGALAGWLAGQPGVRFRWETSLTGLEEGRALTSRGPIDAGRTVVCVGHDVDRLFPDIARAAQVERCVLHMLRVTVPDADGHRVAPAVLSGTSLLRYGGFAACPSVPQLRARIAAERPDLLAADVNLMFTQLPGGDLTIGDTHHHTRTVDPFADESLDALLLAESARLLGGRRLVVRDRWRGTYATAPDDLLVATPVAGARVVSVTTGIGMTLAFGLAVEVLDELLTA
jgi:FAD dependent oxidoreductase TIGR03364